MSSLEEARAVEIDAQVWQLKLYVAGASPKSLKAFANLRLPCRAVHDRDHRPVQAAIAGANRRHRRHPDPGAGDAGTDTQDHRRPL
jgi:hypothetical protein